VGAGGRRGAAGPQRPRLARPATVAVSAEPAQDLSPSDAGRCVEWLRFGDSASLARAAARAWLREVERAHRAGRRHAVALSGGRTAAPFFAAALVEARHQRVPFDHVSFFWADERCVPPDDPASNFRLAALRLLRPLHIPPAQIHRIRGEDAPDRAAARAEAELRAVLGGPATTQPALDLVLLGLGEDGHVASLFPSEPEVVRANPAVFRVIYNAPKPPPCRVTLGYGALAAARQVWVLASGPGKAAALRESLRRDGTTPLSHLLRSRSHTRIFSDLGAG